jgi:hypothetical protein
MGFFIEVYVSDVDGRSHTPTVQSTIIPRYISTIGGAKLKNFFAFGPVNIFGRQTSMPAIKTRAAMYIKPSLIIFLITPCLS